MTGSIERFFNRELSWIEFNQRVLDEARNAAVPLLERVRFLAITASNLDEFFMVRVGSLRMLQREGVAGRDAAGLTAVEQLRRIAERVRRFSADQYACLLEDLLPGMRAEGIRFLSPGELTGEQRSHLRDYFRQQVAPVLSPMAVGGRRRFPLLRNLGLHFAVRLAPPPGSRIQRFAIVPADLSLERIISLADPRPGRSMILLEEVSRMFIGEIFPGETVRECVAFRITRNADMQIDEDVGGDLLTGMQRLLVARRTSECVRLEIEAGATRILERFLLRALGVTERQVYRVPGMIDPAALNSVVDLPAPGHLRYPRWDPVEVLPMDPSARLFDLLARQPVLLVHPYESFDPVLRLITEAAEDPHVLSIKITLYRTSRNSPVVEALRRAAQNGKYVTALVELKARFDEARNIGWAQRLEEDGVQVIHGVRGLKTHSKICLVVRRGLRGTERYVHFGTGNYNETTARLYSDISYMTSDETLGHDASTFFNVITGYSSGHQFAKLRMAPSGLRESLLELIHGETERARGGQPARIMGKMNSLVDVELIEALYDASTAGVEIHLNVRGICCLRPGVPGLSENISVVSIVDRFLEHSRIFFFHHGGDQRVFIASADWMPRNLDRRIELLVPVEHAASKQRLMHLLSVYFSDCVKGRHLFPDGTYHIPPAEEEDSHSAQERLCREALDLGDRLRSSRRTTFDLHLPQNN